METEAASGERDDVEEFYRYTHVLFPLPFEKSLHFGGKSAPLGRVNLPSRESVLVTRVTREFLLHVSNICREPRQTRD